jgi:hypothetical protein
VTKKNVMWFLVAKITKVSCMWQVVANQFVIFWLFPTDVYYWSYMIKHCMTMLKMGNTNMGVFCMCKSALWESTWENKTH